MAEWRSQETFMGLVSLALVAWTLWIIRRGVRDGRLPFSTTSIFRSARPGAYWTLLVFYVTVGAVLAVSALDLLAGVDVRNWI